jgi:hypothetical protein
VFAMRADSTVGRIIGALARTSPAEAHVPTHGLNRQSRLGLVVSALSRESTITTTTTTVASRSAATVALIESRAAARVFISTVALDCRPILDAYIRLEELSEQDGIAYLQLNIGRIPREQSKISNGRRFFSLTWRDVEVLLLDLLTLSLLFLFEVRRLKRMIRHSDHSIYANFIADETVSKLDAGVHQARSIYRMLFEATLFHRWPLATRLRTTILAFGHTTRDLMAFATSSVDAANADLSGLSKLKRHQLVGVEWTKGTTWPPNLMSQVVAWSSEIREGVFVIVEGNSERDLSAFVLT